MVTSTSTHCDPYLLTVQRSPRTAAVPWLRLRPGRRAKRRVAHVNYLDARSLHAELSHLDALLEEEDAASAGGGHNHRPSSLSSSSSAAARSIPIFLLSLSLGEPVFVDRQQHQVSLERCRQRTNGLS